MEFKRPRALHLGTQGGPRLNEYSPSSHSSTFSNRPGQVSENLSEYYVSHVQPNQSSQFPQTPSTPQPREVNVTTQSPTPNIHNKPQIPSISPPTNVLDKSIQFSNVLIDGVVSSTPIQVLVDTGAAVTVISTEFYHKVLSMSSPLENSQILQSVKTANGAHIPIEGIATFDIRLGRTEYRCSAYVISGLSYSVVLGRDFLQQNRAIINMGTHTVEFPGDDVLNFANESSPPSPLPVKCGKTQIIDAHCEAVIPATIGLTPNNVIGLIEPGEQLMNRYHLAGAASLVCPGIQGNVPFRLANPTDKPVTVFRGATLGQFIQRGFDVTPVDTVAPISCNQLPTPTQLCTHPPTLNRLRSESSEPNLAASETPPPSTSHPTTTPADLPDLSKSVLTPPEKQALTDLLNEYPDVLSQSTTTLGRTNLVQHKIDVGSSPPIRQPPYRVAHAQRQEIENHVSDMLQAHLIQPSHSPWSAPVVLVKKKDGSTRFCVDYRKLNSVTRKDSYPIPRVDDALDALAGAKYFSTLDLRSGYHQVEMDKTSQQYTAFATASGLYEFCVLPFGLCNAPSTFQRLMHQVLHGLDWNICLIYLDDIIIFSRTFEEHLSRLRLVLDRLRAAKLTLNPSKCFFGQQSVLFLGHLISQNGVQPNPAKTQVVRDFPRPHNVKDIRAFIGLASYYRRFVKDFSSIAAPLTRLTRKSTPFQWDEACETAFKRLKDALTTPPILAYPNLAQPFHLYVDASATGLGYILGQNINGQDVVIAYGGRQLNKAECNYSTTEREALAVVEGIKKYQVYLHGQKFYVHTDHHALQWLMGIKDPTGKLARWALQLQHYDFEIIHRPGKSNGNADAISRVPYSNLHITAINTPGVQFDTVHDLQRRDPDLQNLITYLESNQLPHDNRVARTLLLHIDDFYLDDDGILCHLWYPGKRRAGHLFSQLVVPSSLRHEILTNVHDDATGGHLGIHKTYEKLRRKYYWFGMFKDVEHWCKSCVDCSMKKSPRYSRQAPLLPIPVEGAFDRVAVDVLGPFPVTNSGARYIVVFSDYYTRWPEAFALPSCEAHRIASLLINEIMIRHSAPRTLLSDRGRNFLSALVKECCKIMNTTKLNTTAYHPQTDGLVERFNGTLAETLSMFVSSNQKDWDEHLPQVLFAYRVSPNATTGESPFYLLYGREPRLPMDVSLLPPTNLSPSVAEHRARIVTTLEEAQQLIQSNTQRAQLKMKARYDQSARPVPYTVGQRVWVYTPKHRKGLSKKLLHNFHGPYRIVEKLSPVHFKLRTLENKPVNTPVHANRLKPYFDPKIVPSRPH